MRRGSLLSCAVWALGPLALIAAGAGTVHAHPSIEHRIEAADAAVAESPEAARFLERAELLRIAGRCDEALADCVEAARRGADAPDVEIARARVALDCGDGSAAETAARKAIAALESRSPDPFSAGIPDTRRALAGRVLAAALGRAGRHAEAAVAGEDAIAAAEVATPDDFLDAATQWEAAREPDRALAVLDLGLQRLGPLSVLQSRAVAVERAAGRPDAAVARLDLLIRSAPRPEAWIAEKGHVLREAGRIPEAWAAYSAALAALEQLPSSQRATRAARRLETDLRAALRAPAPDLDSADPQS